ncbi:MAG: hypothetical protein KAT71_01085 [Gammaproteobacteria bacterium]|nr:hypothetical protein [Gammaproteobacteria bacterium]
MWTQLFSIILVVFLGWLIYRTIKHNPASFSKENLGKSFYTLGLLALALIAFVFLLVMLLRG